jgi:tight adherence protein B
VEAVLALLSGIGVGLGLLLLIDGVSRPRSRPTGRSPALSAVQVGCSAGAAAVAWVVTGWVAAVLLAALAGAVVPPSVTAQRRARSRAERAEALADAAAGLRDAVRAGLGLPEALAGLARFGPRTLRDEFAQVASDARLRGIEPALVEFATRMGDPLADLLASVLVLNARFGGRNLGEVLDGLARSVRDLAATEREVRARQTEQRLSARVVALAPVLALVAFKVANPVYLRPYDTAAGQLVLLVAGLLIGLGYLVMVRIGEPPRGVRLLPGGAR